MSRFKRMLLRLKAQGARLGFSTLVWALAVTGGLLVVGSFVIDFASVLRPVVPPPFHWGVFATGLGLATTALVLGVSRLEYRSGSDQRHEVVSMLSELEEPNTDHRG